MINVKKKGLKIKEAQKEFMECKSNFQKLKKVKKISKSIQKINVLKNLRNPKLFWKTLFKPKKKKFIRKSPIALDEWNEFLIKNNPKTEKIPKKECNNEFNELLDKKISMDELKNCLKKLKAKKATGHDKIGNEFLKELPDVWLEEILIFFNQILDEQDIPEDWSVILIKMIYKKGDISNPTNYRPIALMCCIAKLFTGIFKARLEKWFEEKNFLREEQNGFRKNRGCRDNAFVLDALINLMLSKKGGKLFVFFIDFVTAFPSINHELLWIKLEMIGVSKKFINICKSLYNKAKVKIVTEEGNTIKVEVSEGVMQGETMSGDLFLAFINDLIILLVMYEFKGIVIEMNKEIQALGFADDFALFSENEKDMKEKIRFMEMYCKTNKLNLNVKKSKIIIFHKGNIKKYDFCYRGEKIEIVNNFEYLGIVYSNSGLYHRHLEKLKTNVNLAQNQLINIIQSNKISSWAVIEQLFKTMILNTVNYCSEIWGLHCLDEFDAIQARFYKKLLWLSKSCPMVAIRVEFRLRHISINILRRALSWLENVNAMEDIRLPKICLNSLSKKNDGNNWLNKIVKIVKKVGIELEKGFSIDDIIKQKENIIIEYENFLIKEDWIRFQLVKNLEIGKELNYYKFDCNYFELDLNLNIKKIIAQLRLAVTYNGRIYVRDKKIELNKEECCKICNLNESWTIRHVLTECQLIQEMSKKILNEENLYDITKWYELLNSDNTVTLRKIVVLICKITELNNL